MTYRTAAPLVAVTAIAVSAAIYFGEPFETVTCLHPNGAEISCSSEYASPDDGKDEDLPIALAVLVGGLIIATALLVTRLDYNEWFAAHERRAAETRAARRSREDSHNDDLAFWGYLFGFLFPIIGIVIGIMLVSRNDRRGNLVLILSLVVGSLAVIYFASQAAEQTY
jgi:hypothetical protein